MNKIIFLSVVVSFNAFAIESGVIQFGRVVDLKGAGFISYKGKTREIKKGDVIESGAEIVIEHHGQVTFTDNADHRFHLGNASSASVDGKLVELRSGDLWFQSLNKNDEYKIKSVNAVVSYQGGEGIISYDSAKGKTQLMVINSMMNLANLRAPELNLSVSEGHFSFVDNSYDEGAPRDPTPVGEKTYAQLVSLFSGISPMDKNSAAIFKNHDEVATVTEKAIVKSRSIASVPNGEGDSKLMEDYKNSLLNSKKAVTIKTAATKVNKESIVKKVGLKAEKVAVHIYGQTSTPTVAFTFDVPKKATTESRSRAPASVLDLEVPNENDTLKEVAPNTSPYSKDFQNKNKEQYKESDKLINDLKKL